MTAIVSEIGHRNIVFNIRIEFENIRCCVVVSMVS
jgi:hypothetical protein